MEPPGLKKSDCLVEGRGYELPATVRSLPGRK
jgi:hypothetical protein